MSFIICCHNSEKSINNVINAINKQENENIPFEVILVDNCSIDNTVNVANETRNRTDFNLLVVKESKTGLSYARKKGVDYAKFEYISFIDDDNIIEKKWIVKVYQLFKKMPDVGAIGSHNEPIIEGIMPWWFEKYMFNYACGRPFPSSCIVTGVRKHLWGAGLSIRKEIIKTIYTSNVPLFLSGRKGNLLLSGDDSEICMRCTLLGWKLWFEKTLMLKHIINKSRLNWKYLCRLHQGFGYSKPISNLYKRLIDDLPPQTYFKLTYNTCYKIVAIFLKFNLKLFVTNEGKDFQLQFFNLLGTLKWLLRPNNKYAHISKQIYSQLERNRT